MDEVGVLLGNGDGTFQTAVAYPAGAQAQSVAVTDVNGDGKPDIVVSGLDPSCDGFCDGLVNVLLGNGDGTFQTAVSYSSGGDRPASVAVADVNGDGKPDVVVANDCALPCRDLPSAGSVGVLINISTTPTTTSLISSLNPSNSGQAVTFSATATAQPGFDRGTPTGTVSFLDGTTNIGSSALNNSGVATLTISTLAVGTHSITATYNGDANFNSSTSAVLSQVVLGIVVAPSSLNFPAQKVGTTSSPQTVTVTNSEKTPVSISSIALTGANSSNFLQTNNCPSSLPAGGSCNINVTFSPNSPTSFVATLSVSDSLPGSPQTVALAGSGTAMVTLSPTSITFPDQYVGTSGLPQTVTLTNNDSSAVTISSVTTSTGDFGSLNACGSAVAAGSSCTIGVFFDPTQAGSRTGVLTVTDSASGPLTVTLTGSGQDFSLASSSPTATVMPGKTATYVVSVSALGGFSQNVTLSCSGAPAQSTCSVPSSVTLNGSTPTSVNVTVTTGGSSASLAHPAFSPPSGDKLAFRVSLSGLPGLALVSILGGWSRRRRGYILHGLALLCLLAIGVSMSACGSDGSSGKGNGGGTPPGSYNLTVTGSFTSGSTSLTHTAKLTLVVQ
jgi:hypothetical protein